MTDDTIQCRECGRHLPANQPAYDVKWQEDTPDGNGATGTLWLCHDCISLLPGAP